MTTTDTSPVGEGRNSTDAGGEEPETVSGLAVLDRKSISWPARVGISALFAVLLLALSLATIFRYTATYLQADGIAQSVMSVQHVDLFFWGQNRFASVVPFLASPIADPDANLFACLLINALCFHGLLLIVAWMGVRVLCSERGWLATLIVFLVLAATTQIVVAPGSIHVMALETQPYSMSWLLTLSAFLLWKRQKWWTFVIAVGMVGVAMGLNPSVILVAAFLAIIEMVRRRQWLAWPAFGVVWLAWFAVWQKLSDSFGGTPGPNPELDSQYFTFDHAQFIADFDRAVGSVVSALSPTRLVVLTAVACLCALALSRTRRTALVPRLALVVLFAVGYFTLFAGNPWVARNDFASRYFFPVVMAVPLVLAAAISGALLRVRLREHQLAFRSIVAAGAAAACAAALAGPFIPPSQSPALVEVQATADFMTENDIHFVSGYYWDLWPILHRTLVNGRDAAFMAGYKSGGDPAAYLQRFDEDLSSGTPPRAICVNAPVDYCTSYLGFWTRPGWAEVPAESCPLPGVVPHLGSPPEQSCRILEYTG